MKAPNQQFFFEQKNRKTFLPVGVRVTRRQPSDLNSVLRAWRPDDRTPRPRPLHQAAGQFQKNAAYLMLFLNSREPAQ